MRREVDILPVTVSHSEGTADNAYNNPCSVSIAGAA